MKARHGICLLAALMGACLLPAQTADSLLRAIGHLPDDTIKIQRYRDWYRSAYAEDRVDEMWLASEKGLALSRQLGDERSMGYFYFYHAVAHDMMGKGRLALPLFAEGLKVVERLGDREFAADYHINWGVTLHGLGILDEALTHFFAAYEIYAQTEQNEQLSKILNNIGVIFRTQKKYDRAEEIYRQSLALKQQLKDTLGMAATYQNLGVLCSYSTSGRMQESIDFLQKALDYYLLLDRKEDAAGTQMNIGQTYFNYQKIPEAKARLQAAYRYFEQYPSTEYGPTTFHLLGLIALREQKTAEAEQLLQKGVNQARTVGQLETILPLLNDLAQTQFALGKHAAAYLNLHDAMTLRDSINEVRRIATLEEMQARFDLSQKDNELKINQLELRQRTQQRNGTLLAACLLALLAFLIYYGLRRRLRTNQQLAAQAAEIQRQTLRQLEQDHQLSVLQAMMDGQEQERTRIANDLHDGLGGLLAAVKSHVGALAPGPDTALREKTAQLIDEACGEVRRIAHNMLPRALAHAGLGGALEDLAHDLEKQGLHCDLEIQGLHQAELTAAQNVQVYRIVQELSNNALKHARARRLLLQILAHQDVLTLLVEDDGQGFDPESPAGGIGLASVRSRVAFLQGSVEWDSVPGEGTTVVVQIPLPKKKL